MCEIEILLPSKLWLGGAEEEGLEDGEIRVGREETITRQRGGKLGNDLEKRGRNFAERILLFMWR